MNHYTYHRYQEIGIVWLLFAVASMLACPASAQDKPAPIPVDFNSQVKPILSDRCYLCHGPDSETREADLRFDLEEDAAAAIEAGEPDDSELIARIFSTDDDQMPPVDSNLSLTDEEKDLLKLWIKEGANWEQHWAFVAPQKKPLPEVKDAAWPASEIDRFVLSKIESEGLAPANEATPEKLLRRLTFDLTGLPPTVSELDEFLKIYTGGSPDEAYEKAVDRLLASSRYGERMTSDWLDLARYSDTYGYQVDRDRFVWPWRDWVIRAFNHNMPYDQFITEQLAGDLLPNPTDDQILATTFNRLHPQKVEGGSVEEEFRVEYVADRSQTVGMALMGLTVECARCHDHKYDPISQKEYYELFAFFNNIDEAGLYSYFDASAVPTPTLMLTNEAQAKQLEKLNDAVVGAETELRFYDRELLMSGMLVQDKKTPMYQWLDDSKTRRKQSELETQGLAYAADFSATNNEGNQLVDDPINGKVLKLTGDDEVKLEAGSFDRHDTFTIASRIKIPNSEVLLTRSVIYHRSRAWTDSASRGYQLLIEDGRLSASLIHFWPGNAISVRTVEPVVTEKWLHVAVRYDGSSRAGGLKIFIDGAPAKVEIVRDNLQKTIMGEGTDHLILGARFRDIGFKDGEIADFKVFDRELSKLEIERLDDEKKFVKGLWKPSDRLSGDEGTDLLEYFRFNLDEPRKALAKSVVEARKQLNTYQDGLSEIMVMRETPEPRPAFVLHRGAYDAPTDPVTPATPRVFPGLPEGSPSNRLGLANWLTAPDHPLTARVAVNHYWQLCFGAGLVRTPEDFGSQGQPPTHPALLDWLAVDFEENGWDIQRLLKRIVMSKTYRQSTEATKELLVRDPENRLLARAPSYRLPAEMIRDNLLFASGLLVEEIGGAPVRPYELEESFQPSKPDTGKGLYRRSLYTYWKRTGPAPVMLTLDAAKRDVCQVKRERTSSPLAALVQLNNPQTVEASRMLAEKLIKNYPDDSSEISANIFRTLTSRMPTDEEQLILKTLFESQLAYFKSDETAAKDFLNIGEKKIETDDPATLAAWASVINTLFSFDECVMKR